MTRLTDLDRPFVVAVLARRTIRETKESAMRAVRAGAAAIELNIPLLADEPWEEVQNLVMQLPAPLYTSCRRARFMTVYNRGPVPDWDDNERMERQLDLLKHGSVAIDIELDAFDDELEDGYSAAANAAELQADVAQTAHAAGGQALFSCHSNRPLSREEVIAVVDTATNRGAHLGKIVSAVSTETEALELLAAAALLRQQQTIPTTVIAGGPNGRFTRFVAPVLGRSWALCQDRLGSDGFPDQPEVEAAHAVLRILNQWQTTT